MNFVNQVTVQTLGTGFLINVISINNMPGLLVSVLEVFEELGLHVLEVKASCSDSFRLEAVGGEVRYDSIYRTEQLIHLKLYICYRISDAVHNKRPNQVFLSSIVAMQLLKFSNI